MKFWTGKLQKVVGTPRFELGTPCTPCKCATRLRHVPPTYSNGLNCRAGGEYSRGPQSYAVLRAAGIHIAAVGLRSRAGTPRCGANSRLRQRFTAAKLSAAPRAPGAPVSRS